MRMIDLTKPVQTRDGRKARIIESSANTYYQDTLQPIVALITKEDGKESVTAFSADGRWMPNGIDGMDLINVPEPETRWVNFYDGSIADAVHPDRETADRHQASATRRIACVAVTFKRGDGLL
jgi:hypothetical protein